MTPMKTDTGNWQYDAMNGWTRGADATTTPPRPQRIDAARTRVMLGGSTPATSLVWCPRHQAMVPPEVAARAQQPSAPSPDLQTRIDEAREAIRLEAEIEALEAEGAQ